MNVKCKEDDEEAKERRKAKHSDSNMSSTAHIPHIFHMNPCSVQPNMWRFISRTDSKTLPEHLEGFPNFHIHFMTSVIFVLLIQRFTICPPLLSVLDFHTIYCICLNIQFVQYWYSLSMCTPTVCAASLYALLIPNSPNRDPDLVSNP